MSSCAVLEISLTLTRWGVEVRHKGSWWCFVAAAVPVTGGSWAAKAAAGAGWNWGRGMRHCCDAKQPRTAVVLGGGGQSCV